MEKEKMKCQGLEGIAVLSECTGNGFFSVNACVRETDRGSNGE